MFLNLMVNRHPTKQDHSMASIPVLAIDMKGQNGADDPTMKTCFAG